MTTKITLERAREIAAAFLLFRYTRDKLRVDENLRQKIIDIHKATGLSTSQLSVFFASFIVPAATQKTLGWKHTFCSIKQLPPSIMGETAMAIVQYSVKEEGLTLGPEARSYARKMSEEMDIPLEEINSFVSIHLLPLVIHKFLGVSDWEIMLQE